MTAPTDLRALPASPVDGSRSRRRPDIQGLRAVAVLLVIAFHAHLPVPGGFVGVDVFFVISGFVITGMLAREWAQHGRVRFAHFYFRRFLRLTPALALLVAVVAAASVFLQNPYGAQQTTARTGVGAMLLSANYVIGHAAGNYFADNATTNPLLNTWSLSVEEQFYLVFPALLVLGWVLARRRGRSLRAPLAVVAAIAGGSFALSVAWSYGAPLASTITDYFGGPQSFAFYSSLTRAWEFAAGALLALVLGRLPALTRGTARIAGVVGAGLLVIAAATIHDTDAFPGWIALVPVVGTMLLILAGSHHTVGVSRALSVRPMVFVGDISYSWYLWHWPVIVFAALLLPNRPEVLVLAAAASIVPSLASYWLLEQPLRRLRPRTRRGSGTVIVTTLVIPIAACLVLLAGANSGWGLTAADDQAAPAVAQPIGRPATNPGDGTEAPALAATPAPSSPVSTEAPSGDGEVAAGEGGSLRSQHAAVQAGCVNSGLEPDACRFGPVDARGTVLLAGDSQAYALADGVIAAAQGLDLDTIVTSHTGCPFLGRESSGVHNYPCRSWQESIVDYALAERPSAVIIANRSAGYVHPEWKWRTAERDGGGAATSVDEAADLWRAGLEPIVATLQEEGIPVIIIAAVPEMTGYTVRTSLLSGAFAGAAFELPRSELEADRRPALAVGAGPGGRVPRGHRLRPVPGPVHG